MYRLLIPASADSLRQLSEYQRTKQRNHLETIITSAEGLVMVLVLGQRFLVY